MIRAVANVAAMAPYALADLGGPGMISLAQNESAFGPSPKAIAAGQAAIADGALYPDPDWRDLRASVAEVHGLAPEAILCGAGSMELIGALIRAFTGPGDEVLGAEYGYLFTATACQQSGARYVTAPERGFTVDCAALLAAVTPATRIVFLCNPGNPTGTALAPPEIIALREALPEGVMLVIDQAYGEFGRADPAPLFALVARDDTVILRTFSKAYALASARVGWGLFPQAIGGEMRKLLNPNNVSGVSQAMAAAAMRDQGYMAEITRKTAAIRDQFTTDLRAAGYAIPKSQTNFALIPFESVEEAQRADQLLRQNNILMRAMGGYGLPHCLRATIGAPEVMTRATEILTSLRKATP